MLKKKYKLSELKFTPERLKQGFEWFEKYVDDITKAGNLEKPSKAEVKRVFEKVTGKKIKNKE